MIIRKLTDPIFIHFSKMYIHFYQDKRDYWIVFPWRDFSRLDKTTVNIGVLNLITVNELWKACFFAMCAHKRMTNVTKYRNWIFQ